MSTHFGIAHKMKFRVLTICQSWSARSASLQMERTGSVELRELLTVKLVIPPEQGQLVIGALSDTCRV